MTPALSHSSQPQLSESAQWSPKFHEIGTSNPHCVLPEFLTLKNCEPNEMVIILTFNLWLGYYMAMDNPNRNLQFCGT